MPTSYKLKILLTGPSQSGKRIFLERCSLISSYFPKNYKLTVGVDIAVAQCPNNQNGDSAILSLWDISSNERFHLIYHTFFRGAAGSIIFFNINSSFPIENLLNWIIDIRNFSGNIPIYLVGKIDDFNQILDLESIDLFVEENNLNGFFILPNQINQILDVITTQITQSRQRELEHLKLNTFMPKKIQKIFNKFLKFYKNCPICGNVNHGNYLKSFYFSRNSEHIKLKNKLIELMKKSKNFNDLYKTNISLGIPCCSCFNEIFSKKIGFFEE